MGHPMYITASELSKFWKVNPGSILHVGAHRGEEHKEYKDQSWVGPHHRKAIWVEAQPKLANQLKRTLDPNENLIFNYAVWDQDDCELTFNISNNSQSSSLLQLAKHKQIYPEVEYVESIKVSTIRLDTLLSGTTLKPDFLNLDIQGSELTALKSLGQQISGFKWIYTEVNFEELYEDSGLIFQIDSYLKDRNYRRVFTVRRAGAGWGDALYIRNDILGLQNWINPRLILFRLKNKSTYIKNSLKIKVHSYRKNILRKVLKIRGYFR